MHKTSTKDDLHMPLLQYFWQQRQLEETKKNIKQVNCGQLWNKRSQATGLHLMSLPCDGNMAGGRREVIFYFPFTLPIALLVPLRKLSLCIRPFQLTVNLNHTSWEQWVAAVQCQGSSRGYFTPLLKGTPWLCWGWPIFPTLQISDKTCHSNLI